MLSRSFILETEAKEGQKNLALRRQYNSLVGGSNNNYKWKIPRSTQKQFTESDLLRIKQHDREKEPIKIEISNREPISEHMFEYAESLINKIGELGYALDELLEPNENENNEEFVRLESKLNFLSQADLIDVFFLKKPPIYAFKTPSVNDMANEDNGIRKLSRKTHFGLNYTWKKRIVEASTLPVLWVKSSAMHGQKC